MTTSTIELVPFSQIADQVLPELRGVPLPTIERAFARVAKDFFEFTDAWRITFDNMPLVAGVSQYPLPVELYGDAVMLNKVISVTYGPRKLIAASEITVQNRFGNWRDQTGRVDFYYVDRGEVLNLALPPSEDSHKDLLSVLTTLKPTLRTRFLPADLYYEYEDTLLEGVLGMLARSANKNWTDPQLAGIHLQGYEMAKLRARSHVKHEDTAKVRTARYGGY